MMRAFAFAALLAAAPAAARDAGPFAATPTLKRAVTVSSEIVRIGDLVDNAGAAADTPIFRSPDLGTTGSVSVQQVLDVLKAHHMYLIDTGTVSAVEVTRAGRTIDFSDIDARIARAFAGRYGLGEAKDLTVTLDVSPRPIVVDASATGDLVLRSAVVSPLSGRFEVTYDLPGPSASRRPMRFTGTVVETLAVAVTTRALAPGATVRPSDVVLERRPKAQAGSDTVGATADAIGLALRIPVRAGQPLRRSDLTVPKIVHRDEEITLTYEVPGILLTTRGKALEGGAEGDVISVINVESKRAIQGIVTGPSRVAIKATTARTSPDLVAAAAPRTVASR